VFEGKLPSREKYEELVKSIDVAAPYLYPVPYQPVASVGEAIARAREATRGTKPILPILQLFAWKAEDRYPTPTELRCMTLLALVEGAQGIGYYSYGSVTGRPKTTIAEAQPELWKSLKELNRDVAKCGPRLSAGKATERLMLEPPAGVKVKVVEDDQGVLAVAVNTTDQRQSVKFVMGETREKHAWVFGDSSPFGIKPGRHGMSLGPFEDSILREVPHQ
jgi:hypothetical protein